MAKYFLSHCSNHKPFCEDVKNALESLGHEVWLDSFDLHAGTAIPQAIADGIYDSDHFVLMMTPEITNSVWVDWEINVATNREITARLQNFVIPVMLRQVPPPKLIAHKLFIPVTANINDLIAALVAPNGTATVIGQGFHLLNFQINPIGTFNVSFRRFYDALVNSFCVQAGVYSYFPNFTRQSLTAIKNGRMLVSQSERDASANVQNRDTLIELYDSGRIVVYETATDALGTDTIFWTSRMVSKVANIVAKMNQVYRDIGFNGQYELTVSIVGLENGFRLNGLSPADCEPPNGIAVGGRKTAPMGTQILARRNFQTQAAAINATALSPEIYDLLADLFFPIQISRMFGGGTLPLKISLPAVTRIANLMLNQGQIE